MLLLYGRLVGFVCVAGTKQQKILVHVGYCVENVKTQNKNIYISICKKV